MIGKGIPKPSVSGTLAQRDSNGVPLITMNLLNDATGAWTVVNNIDRPTSADANGEYVFVAHLEHFSTYVITANTATAPTSGSGGARGHSSTLSHWQIRYRPSTRRRALHLK